MCRAVFSLSFLTVLCFGEPVSAREPDQVSFSRDIAPLLLGRCAGCHGDKVIEGGFRLHTYEFLLRSGDSGESPIVAGDVNSSEMFLRIVEQDEGLRMPQEDDPLTETEIKRFRLWIEQGAKFDGIDPKMPFASQLVARTHPPAPETYRLAIPIMSLQFSPDGNQIAVGGYHEVTIWESATGEPVRRIGGMPQRIQDLIWKENLIIVGGGTPGEYGEVLVVDSRGQSNTKSLTTFSDIVLGVDLDSTATRVAACSANRSTKLIQVENAKLLWEKNFHSSWVTGVAFSADDQFIVTTSLDETCKVLNAKTSELFTIFNGHRQQLGDFPGRFKVNDVTLNSANKLFVTGGEGKALRVWDPVKAKSENGTAADMEDRFYRKAHTQYVVHGFQQPVHRIATTTKYIVAAGADRIVKLFDAEQLNPIRALKGHTDWIFSLATSADGAFVAAGSYDGQVIVWDLETGVTISSFTAAP